MFRRIVVRGNDSIACIVGSDVKRSPINIHFHRSRHFFFFGRGSTSNTATFEMGSDGTRIIIGEDCMFSALIDVTTDDMHGIIDLSDGRHLNPAADDLMVVFRTA